MRAPFTDATALSPGSIFTQLVLTCPHFAPFSRNSTFLTVEREAFGEIFGSYFQGRMQQAHDFFLNSVDM